MKPHFEESLVVSRICGHLVRDKYNIRLHLEGKHDLSEGYTCTGCSNVFKTMQVLSQHRSQCVFEKMKIQQIAHPHNSSL